MSGIRRSAPPAATATRGSGTRAPARELKTEQEPERSSKLNARLALALTVVIGQLWGLTVTVNEWMKGNTGTAWWGRDS